jgi:hypothetical protein
MTQAADVAHALQSKQQQDCNRTTQRVFVDLPYHSARILLLPADLASKFACRSLEEAKEAFLQQHGSSYGYKGWMDQKWQEEVGDRLGQGQHYLDYTGTDGASFL